MHASRKLPASLFLAAVFIMVLALVPASTASATTLPPQYYLIDNGSGALDPAPDTVSDSITGSQGPECTLRDALDLVNAEVTALGLQANGCTISNPSGAPPASPVYVINLPAYTYTLVNTLPNDALQVTVPVDVTIAGVDPASTIVEAAVDPPGGADQASNRVFDFYQANVQLANLTVRHGFCSVSSGSVFSSCGLNQVTHGGGILVYFATLTLDNVAVSDSFASSRGGGVYVTGAGSSLSLLNGSTISGNQAGRPEFGEGRGGGIYNNGGALLVNDSAIVDNRADGSGGGVYQFGDGGATVENNSLIDGNVADGATASIGGGGIYNRWSALTVDNSVISNNRAFSNSLQNGRGGGIYSEGPDAVVLIRNGSIVGGQGAGNLAGEGSGLFNGQFGDPEMIVDGSEVSYNGPDSADKRSRDGGGIYNQSRLTVRNNARIEYNVTELYSGAGILNRGGTVTVTGSTLHGNAASPNLGGLSRGGGLANWDGGNVEILSSQVSGNSARVGGGLSNEGAGSSITVEASHVHGNQATGSGGGLANFNGGQVHLRAGTVVGGAGAPNTASFNGGGIYNGDPLSAITVEGSAVDGNVAAYSGGGIYNGNGLFSSDGGGPVSVINGSSVSGNTATSFDGGGIFNSGVASQLSISDSAVDGNSAGQHGGAIHNEAGGQVSLVDSQVSGNSAAQNGGALHSVPRLGLLGPLDMAVDIRGSMLLGNSAGAAGGAVFNDAGYQETARITIRDSTVGSAAEPNTAPFGGAIANSASSSSGFAHVALLEGSVLASNQATASDGGAIANSSSFNGTATITIEDSSLLANQAQGRGGGLHNFATSGGHSAVSVSGASVLQANSAGGQGGLFFNDSLFEFGSGGTAEISVAGARMEDNGAASGGVLYQGQGADATSTSAISASFVSANQASVQGGAVYHDGGSTSLTASCVLGNSDTAFFNATTAVQAATHNWWSSSDGPAGAGPGTGDTVSANVAFDPWNQVAYTGASAFAHDAGVVLQASTRSSDGVPLASIEVQFYLDGALVGEAVSDLAGLATLDIGPLAVGTYDVAVAAALCGQTADDPTTIAVFDPGAGFVTGGGWIDSAAGWCQLDDLCASAAGKAHFEFDAKYKKNATIPTGDTEFDFPDGGLTFQSDAYEWLVVDPTGIDAQFKGWGKINGQVAPGGEPYQFMVWARDLAPDGDDTFRIRIWYLDNGSEVVVYDNGFDQPLGGGSIQVHQ